MANDYPLGKIARALHRSPGAVRERVRHLGLHNRPAPPSPADERVVRQWWEWAVETETPARVMVRRLYCRLPHLTPAQIRATLRRVTGLPLRTLE